MLRKNLQVCSSAADERCRILDAPMRRHRLAGPDGAHLAGGVVADREHEVERRPAAVGELVPALAAQRLGPIVQPLAAGERHRMDLALRVAAGARSP